MIILTDENFDKEISNSKIPVLVDFYADWCPPCRLLSPIVEELSEIYEGRALFAKVNTGESPALGQRFKIINIPTVVLLKGGIPVSGFVGAKPKEEIKKWIDENLQEEGERIKSIISEYERYAKKSGFKLNPDNDVVERIVKGLLEREKRFGAKFCPCRSVTDNPEENAKIVCPCFYHREEIKEKGRCVCGLFVK